MEIIKRTDAGLIGLTKHQEDTLRKLVPIYQKIQQRIRKCITTFIQHSLDKAKLVTINE